MFVQISPSENDSGETLSSLNFATRVRGVELGPVKKQIDTSELQKTKQMVSLKRQLTVVFFHLNCAFGWTTNCQQSEYLANRQSCAMYCLFHMEIRNSLV